MVRIFKFSILLLVYTSIQTQFSKAQSDLRNDADFFQSKKSETDNWINKTGIGQIFQLDDIEVNKDKLKVTFMSTLNTADSTVTAWNLLKRQFDHDDKLALPRQLFNSIAFEMEVGKDSLELILSSKLKDYTVTISYDKKEGVKVVEDTYLMATRSFKTIIIKVDDLSLTGRAENITSDQLTIKEIRKILSNFMNDYYKSKGTFWYDAQMDILKDNYNELTFEVTKLSKEIISDRNYFEYIRIEIKIQKNEKDFEIKYQIQGKYSGGFGFAPRRTEYRNMEPGFSDYLSRYEEKIVQRINKLLTK